MTEQIKLLSLGADIEFFIEDKQSKLIKTAEPYVKGTKYEPFQYGDNKWFTTSLDNVLMEITIEPTLDKDIWVNGIISSKKYLESLLPENLQLCYLPSARLLDDQLESDVAKTFGCEPTQNTWSKSQNPAPKSNDLNLRSSGFHVHFGYDNPRVEADEAIVKAMDLFVAVPSVIIEPLNKRRELYGKAGECRFKSYGIETRQLSGHFAKNETLIEWVFIQSIKAIDYINKNGCDEIEASKDIIIEAINTSNQTLANNLIRQFELNLP